MRLLGLLDPLTSVRHSEVAEWLYVIDGAQLQDTRILHKALSP